MVVKCIYIHFAELILGGGGGGGEGGGLGGGPIEKNQRLRLEGKVYNILGTLKYMPLLVL